MYFTDRGIEELEKRRGEEEVTFEWLAEQLRTFVDLNPDFEVPVERLPAGRAPRADGGGGGAGRAEGGGPGGRRGRGRRVEGRGSGALRDRPARFSLW